MKISLFYEFALPRPWQPDDERALLQECLDEVEAADRAGFSTVWLTEHHFLGNTAIPPRRRSSWLRQVSGPRTSGSDSASCTCRRR